MIESMVPCEADICNNTNRASSVTLKEPANLLIPLADSNSKMLSKIEMEAIELTPCSPLMGKTMINKHGPMQDVAVKMERGAGKATKIIREEPTEEEALDTIPNRSCIVNSETLRKLKEKILIKRADINS